MWCVRSDQRAIPLHACMHAFFLITHNLERFLIIIKMLFTNLCLYVIFSGVICREKIGLILYFNINLINLTIDIDCNEENEMGVRVWRLILLKLIRLMMERKCPKFVWQQFSLKLWATGKWIQKLVMQCNTNSNWLAFLWHLYISLLYSSSSSAAARWCIDDDISFTIFSKTPQLNPISDNQFDSVLFTAHGKCNSMRA